MTDARKGRPRGRRRGSRAGSASTITHLEACRELRARYAQSPRPAEDRVLRGSRLAAVRRSTLEQSERRPVRPGAGLRTARERLGDAVREVEFARDEMLVLALSPEHYRVQLELTIGPFAKAVKSLASDPARLREFRSQLASLIDKYLRRNQVQQSCLLTRALKKD